MKISDISMFIYLAFFLVLITYIFSLMLKKRTDLKEDLSKIKEHGESILFENNLNKIVDGLKNKELGLEIIDKIKSEIENLNKKINGFSYNVAYTLKTIEKSLKEQISRLQKTSLINLYMGTTLTCCSLVFLFGSVNNSTLENNLYSNETPLDYISYILVFFLPKISLTIFIQLFAFFFLRLYKSNLNDIKYYQNELVTFYYKKTSIQMAYISKNEKSIELLIAELSKIEKSTLIPKGYTSTEIENEKLAMSSIKENESIINLLKDFLKSRS
ncbi:hypothetical protein GY065_05810 [Snodgrassella sp. ESL0323]|uniref:hypothetical protein n=1 Tax=Snodgrassella sp. ESL0323 TaxID=2705034 RepID=UPI0015831E2E|nr:hypothetical protein [Snodgrassella sp. ESL0323]NUF78440.1 hypothetical protein [Snodgrassella sp. ESL0323]